MTAPSIILYTRKFELKFDKNEAVFTDLSALMEELSKEYILLDSNPAVHVENNIQYVTFKLSKKEERKKIGF